ncbi:hypothetical protein [Segatella buccae]|uniref:hypothetical protein n=1 Tax=Segatella buccae TaxID=28126 RepID=UPI001C5E2B14|nr:hypothetical protein [Segatella buccae]
MKDLFKIQRFKNLKIQRFRDWKKQKGRLSLPWGQGFMPARTPEGRIIKGKEKKK